MLILVGAGAVWGVTAAGGGDRSGSSSAQARETHAVEVSFAADAGVENRRILELGGLVVQASCIDYGGGRKYLSVASNGTTGTLSYARPDGGQVSLTFETDQDAPEDDCIFTGRARYVR